MKGNVAIYPYHNVFNQCLQAALTFGSETRSSTKDDLSNKDWRVV